MHSVKLRKWLVFANLLLLASIASVIPSAASQMESFYALPKSKFEKFCEIAHLVPKSQIPPVDSNVHYEARLVTPEEMKGQQFQKVQDHYKTVWDYIHDNGKQPFTLQWSGMILYDVLDLLKTTRKIDLMQRSVCERTGEFEWFVIDKDLKDQYLDKLNPSNFSEVELRNTFSKEYKRKRDEHFKKLETKLSKEKFKETMATQAIIDKEEDFPERGKAMMDAIKLIHQYLQMVDDNTVVILNIG